MNHNGSLELGKALVDAAADVGADVVKFQTFRAQALATCGAPKATYQTRETGVAESQREMLAQLELTDAEHRTLFDHCRSRGIQFLSTPFDLVSLDFLVATLGVTKLKIGSGDLTNAPLLLAVAETNLPLILSTGMSSLGEVEAALSVLAYGFLGKAGMPGGEAFRRCLTEEKAWEVLRRKVTLLHCTTEYPADLGDVNLRAIDTLSSSFGLSVGFSDHTPGIVASVAAVARGAQIVEKHLTLDKSLPGPDHTASLDPAEFKSLVAAIRAVEQVLGNGIKQPRTAESNNRVVARRSLVAADRIKIGERFSADNITAKRPGNGIAPMHYWDYLGRPAPRDYDVDEPLD